MMLKILTRHTRILGWVDPAADRAGHFIKLIQQIQCFLSIVWKIER